MELPIVIYNDSIDARMVDPSKGLIVVKDCNNKLIGFVTRDVSGNYYILTASDITTSKFKHGFSSLSCLINVYVGFKFFFNVDDSEGEDSEEYS
jgi:hypothetical protein